MPKRPRQTKARKRMELALRRKALLQKSNLPIHLKVALMKNLKDFIHWLKSEKEKKHADDTARV